MALSLIPKAYAQSVSDIVGKVNPSVTPYGSVTTGFTSLFNNILRLVFVVAGMYALINFILAGYTYMSAGGDSKQLTKAWDQIWQTILGLIVLAASFVLAGVFGYLIFGDAGYILHPVIYGPTP
jgi:hypothetical protein